mmetsp:Transcript_6724/g.8791  ORF Transcript_6724/g.8791 Transcript_6724/m.8791 type:complete len:349 (+) Transcript_6724:416-1462(+)
MSSAGEDDVHARQLKVGVDDDASKSISALTNPSKTDRAGATQNCKQFCYSFLSKESIFGIIVFLGMIVLVLYLVAEGYIETIRNYVLEIGFGGYVIFFCLILLVAQPFGFGYTPLIVAVGFVYGWPGLVLSQISIHVGCLITFFEIRYCGRDYLKKRVEKLEPKLQLIVKKLESVATQDIRTAYPLMVFSRNSPISIGLVNGIWALTEVSAVRFYITTIIGTIIEQPISINIGIIFAEIAGLNEILDDKNSTEFDPTINQTIEKLEDEAGDLQNGILIFSIIITCLFLFGSISYSIWMVRKLRHADENEVWEHIDNLDKHILSDDFEFDEDETSSDTKEKGTEDLESL